MPSRPTFDGIRPLRLPSALCEHGHVKAIVTTPPLVDAGEQRLEQIENTPIRLSFFLLFWIYMLVSVVGLFVETAVSYPIYGVWKDRAGLVLGPFSPIYGLGAVILTVLLNRFRSGPSAVLFAVASLIGGVFEYCAGVFWERMFGFVAWNYSDQPFNIGGYTCLGISLCWGFIGLVWMKWLFPIVVRLIELIPPSVRGWLTAVACAFMVADIAMTLMAFSCWFDRQAGLPVQTAFQQFFATYYSDAFMENRFQTITMYPQLAQR
jgi:uncharacterized membrane protein